MLPTQLRWVFLFSRVFIYVKIILTENQVETLIEELKWKKNKAVLKKKLPSNMDLHIYAAMRFAKLTTSPLTEKELRPDTLQTLSNILCEKSNRMKTCDPSMWTGKDPKGNSNKNYLGYLDYSSLYSKSPEYDPSFKKSSFSYSQPKAIKELMLPVPLEESPIAVFEFVHSYTVPGAP